MGPLAPSIYSAHDIFIFITDIGGRLCVCVCVCVCVLTKLIDRRFRGDMIQTYKILTNKDDTNRETFFQMAEESGGPELRRGLNFFKKRSRRRRRRNVFSQRALNPWNHERREVVQERKIYGFKAKFDMAEMYRVDIVG